MSLPYKNGNIPLAKQLRKAMTKQERHLWYDCLRNLPVRFQRQKAIGPYIVDFYCHEAKLVIELDGSQHFEDKGHTSDTRRDEYLGNLGLKILRIPNSNVDCSFEAVCTQIIRCLKGSLPEGAVGEAD